MPVSPFKLQYFVHYKIWSFFFELSTFAAI